MALHGSQFPLICWIRASDVLKLSRGSGVLPSFSCGRIWGENDVTLLLPWGERLVDMEPHSPSLSSSVGSLSAENHPCVLHITTTKPKKIRDVDYISEDPISNLAHPRHAPYCIQSFFPVSLNPIMNRNLGSYIIAGGLTDRTVLGNVTASQLYHLHERWKIFFLCMHYPNEH